MTTKVSVDVVVLALTPSDPAQLTVLLSTDPASDTRRLPGDLLDDDESLEQAAGRVMAGVGLLEPRHIEQLASFGDPDRAPAPRTVSVSYLALVPQPFAPSGGAEWVPATDTLGPLCWDHDTILSEAIQRVRSKLSYSNIAFGLLADEFTMSELQEVYEAVLGTTLDKRNFRKKLRALSLLEETGDFRRGSHRPAALHRFTSPGLVLLDDTIISG